MDALKGVAEVRRSVSYMRTYGQSVEDAGPGRESTVPVHDSMYRMYTDREEAEVMQPRHA